MDGVAGDLLLAVPGHGGGVVGLLLAVPGLGGVVVDLLGGHLIVHALPAHLGGGGRLGLPLYLVLFLPQWLRC